MAASAYPGSNNGNLHSCPNSSAINSDQRDPNVQSGSQFPGPSSHPQNHVPSRPVFYVPAPPPPPFLHYQWPLPFSYNPFTGFPGIGESYGFSSFFFFLFLFHNFKLMFHSFPIALLLYIKNKTLQCFIFNIITMGRPDQH